MIIAGTIYNGIQRGYGVVPDLLVFADITTRSTFGVEVGASVEQVEAIRDMHREHWKQQEKRHEQKKIEAEIMDVARQVSVVCDVNWLLRLSGRLQKLFELLDEQANAPHQAQAVASRPECSCSESGGEA